MKTPRQRPLFQAGLLVAAALMLGACGASASPSPSAASAAPLVAPSVEASVPAEASPSAEGSQAIPSFVLPSFNADVDLEKQLPDTLGGVKLQKFSFKGADFLKGSDPSTKSFNDLLAAIGKTPADMSIAIAGGGKVTVGAFKISGADANVVLNAFVQAAVKNQTGSSTSDTSISGKSVKKVTTTTSTTPSYVYAHGDVVFFVSGDDMTLVTEAFSKLP
jgi:hypothetical protein